MFNKKLTYHFYWRISQGPKKAEQGFGHLTICFYQNGKGNVFKEKPTGLKCYKHEFDPLAQRFVGEDSKIRNLELTRIRYHAEEAILSFTTTGSTVLFNKSHVKNDETINITPRTLVEVVHEYIKFQSEKIRKEGQPKHLGNIEQTTFNTYTIRAEKVLFPYLRFKGLMDIQLHQVDSRFLESFDIWITNTPNYAGKVRGQLWATKNIKFVKQVLNYAVGGRYLNNNLANYYRTKKETPKPVETLSIEDIEKLKTCEFIDTTEQEVLDMFLFCFETFLHFGDYTDLTEDHIKTDKDGQKWIIKTRKKAQEENRQVMRVPLSKTALELIDKYGEIDDLPRRSSGEVSVILREMALRVNLDKPIKFKMSRSSGISHAYNTKSMRAESIAVLAGWETVRELKSYLKIDLTKIKNEFLNNQNPQNHATMYQI